MEWNISRMMALTSRAGKLHSMRVTAIESVLVGKLCVGSCLSTAPGRSLPLAKRRPNRESSFGRLLPL
jgi:hypothetical protein